MARQTVPEAHLKVRVQPGARASEVAGVAQGVVRIRVTAPAHEGRANQALVELLADLLGVPRSRVRILRGAASRDKVVAVDGVTEEEAVRKLTPR
ncbi:MAG: DUF167 domain-containing protein [Chloroflexi bacterium]|nr:DUF167 domain-containing protein [Chloroflexota bacterium]